MTVSAEWRGTRCYVAWGAAPTGPLFLLLSGPYSASKLGNIYFTRELARRLEGSDITVNAVHPGLIFTNLGIGNNPGPAQKLLGAIWSKFSLHESEGHRCPVYAATAPELEGVTGEYIADCRVAKLKPIALKEAPAKRLWDVSETTTGVRFPADS